MAKSTVVITDVKGFGKYRRNSKWKLTVNKFRY